MPEFFVDASSLILEVMLCAFGMSSSFHYCLGKLDFEVVGATKPSVLLKSQLSLE